MLELDFYNKTRKKIPTKIFEELLKNAEKVLCGEKIINREKNYLIELTLVGSTAIAAINRWHRGINKPTDVISLSYFDKNMPDPLAGEIFICLPFAAVQAKKMNQTLIEELKFLFIHGLLHILGFDHEKRAGEKRMNAIAGIINRR